MTSFFTCMAFALTLAATDIAAKAAVCTDHNPVLSAITEKMKLPSEFRTCDHFREFCNEDYLVQQKIDLKALTIDYDKQAMERLIAEVTKLEDAGNMTSGNLISLACPATCGTCTSRALAASDDAFSSLRGNERRLSPIYACGCNCNCVGSKIKCKAAKSRIPACSTFAKYRRPVPRV